MKVLQGNCRYVFAASTDLNVLVSKVDPHLILLQETWLSPDKSFNLPNFRSFRLDRQSRGGGLLTFVSRRFCHKAKISYQIMSGDGEILGVEISLPRGQMFSVVNAYFPLDVLDTQPLDAALLNW